MANHNCEEGTIISSAVAIDKDKNSQFAVKWAIDNLMSKDKRIILVHVTGTPNSNLQDGIPREGRALTQAETQQLFLPYRSLCARKGITVKEVVLHDKDIAGALTEYIIANSIKTIVLGASSHGAISRMVQSLTSVRIGVISSRPSSGHCTMENGADGATSSWKKNTSPLNNRDYLQTNTSKRPARGKILLQNSEEISESIHMVQSERRNESENPTPVESAAGEETSLDACWSKFSYQTDFIRCSGFIVGCYSCIPAFHVELIPLVRSCVVVDLLVPGSSRCVLEDDRLATVLLFPAVLVVAAMRRVNSYHTFMILWNRWVELSLLRVEMSG
ncbi:U-box domain-containing protein 52 [Dorcoceras hygrometricum]|uniref:RING-type E3 ubiquitin transferase n=1 Tax=Dorcoceras hygrometricum TaxID=472368 RepID=A0A2Z7B4I7_9LAMI|nr:U-box domain-containing protein 52 [Dorcoceras hygrometricum]